LPLRPATGMRRVCIAVESAGIPLCRVRSPVRRTDIRLGDEFHRARGLAREGRTEITFYGSPDVQRGRSSIAEFNGEFPILREDVGKPRRA
jgi:hypothetical protein